MDPAAVLKKAAEYVLFTFADPAIGAREACAVNAGQD